MDSGASMHNAEQGDLSSDTMDKLRRSNKTHMRLTATGASANKRVSTSFCSWSRSVRNSAITRWNASDSVASSALLRTRIFMWVKTAKLYDWPQIGRQLLVQWTTQHFSLYQDSHHSPAAVCLHHRDQRISPIISEKLGLSSDPLTTRSDKHACGKPMLTDHDKQATENREPANEMNKEDPTQGTPVWLQPCTVNLEDEDMEARVLAHSSERANSDSKGDASKVETQKTEAWCSCLLPQKPKEIYSAIRKIWWLDNSRAQSPQRRTWISEQSPIRCRGTSSRHSVESVSNHIFTGDGEEFTKAYRSRRRSQNKFIRTIH